MDKIAFGHRSGSGKSPAWSKNRGSLSEIVTPSGASTESLLKLPASRASKRLQIQRHLPSGLAAVEALLPLGEGQRLGLVGPPGTGKSTALRTLVADGKVVVFWIWMHLDSG